MSETSNFACLHALINGRVQGVGFRYFVVEHANALRLNGWVRNKWSGEVEVTAEGPRSDLETLLENLKRGPGHAFVSDVQFDWSVPTGRYDRFQIISTG